MPHYETPTPEGRVFRPASAAFLLSRGNVRWVANATLLGTSRLFLLSRLSLWKARPAACGGKIKHALTAQHCPRFSGSISLRCL